MKKDIEFLAEQIDNIEKQLNEITKPFENKYFLIKNQITPYSHVAITFHYKKIIDKSVDEYTEYGRLVMGNFESLSNGQGSAISLGYCGLSIDTRIKLNENFLRISKQLYGKKEKILEIVQQKQKVIEDMASKIKAKSNLKIELSNKKNYYYLETKENDNGTAQVHFYSHDRDFLTELYGDYAKREKNKEMDNFKHLSRMQLITYKNGEWYTQEK